VTVHVLEGGVAYQGEGSGDHPFVPHGVGRWTDPDGGWYQGDFVEGVRHGQGICLSYHGDDTYEVYDGQWVLGDQEGQGRFCASNGYVCEGAWVANLAQGQCKVVYPDGGTYEGAMFKQKRSGYGVYVHRDGEIYRGLWVDDVQHGAGMLTFLAGNRGGDYTGGFIHGKFNGYGKRTFGDGTFYDGQWAQGKPDGLGTHTYPVNLKCNFSSPTRYVGHFVKGLRHGPGVHSSEDGSKSEGQWKKGVLNGHGEDVDRTNPHHLQRYVGDFLDWKRHGQGVLEIVTPDFTMTIRGTFKDDEPNGRCEQVFVSAGEDDTHYSGMFKNGMRSGKGILTHKGTTYSGDFRENAAHGHGTETTAVDRYVGQFRAGKRDGSGVLTWTKTGVIVRGVWKEDCLVSAPYTSKEDDPQETAQPLTTAFKQTQEEQARLDAHVKRVAEEAEVIELKRQARIAQVEEEEKQRKREAKALRKKATTTTKGGACSPASKRK
jgi:hypothetical protein